MKEKIDWQPMITLTGIGLHKVPAIRISGATIPGGFKVSYTFCLYHEERLQTIMHLPDALAGVFCHLLHHAVSLAALVQTSTSSCSPETFRRIADSMGFPYLGPEIEERPHHFERRRPPERIQRPFQDHFQKKGAD